MMTRTWRPLHLALLLPLLVGGSDAFFIEFFKAGFIRGVAEALKPNRTSPSTTTTSTTAVPDYTDPSDYQDYAIADTLYDYGANVFNVDDGRAEDTDKNLTFVEIPDLTYLGPSNTIAPDLGENYLQSTPTGRNLVNREQLDVPTQPSRRVDRSAIFHERGSSVSGYETADADAKNTTPDNTETSSDGRIYASADYDPIPSFDKVNEIIPSIKLEPVDGPIYISKYANSKITPAPQAIPFVSDFYAPNSKFGLVEPVVVVTSRPSPEPLKPKTTTRAPPRPASPVRTRPIAEGLRPEVRPARLTHVIRNYRPGTHGHHRQGTARSDPLKAYFLLRLAQLRDDDDD